MAFVLPPVVGLDIGHSAVKISFRTAKKSGRHTFPSAVRPARPISDEVEARRAAAETVVFGGTSYWVGGTAISQSSDTIGLADEWIDSDPHTALLLYSAKWLAEQGVSLDSPDTQLVMGLPSLPLPRLKALLASVVAHHFPKVSLKILPQPMGPYYNIMYGDDGRASEAHVMENESWAVVDVGFFTTDFAMMKLDRWNEDSRDSCAGINLAADILLSILRDERGFHHVTHSEMESAMHSGAFKYNGTTHKIAEDVARAYRPLVEQISEKAMAAFGANAHSLDGILIAGGGASLVFPGLRELWPHAVLADEPRFAVADGFCRFGTMCQVLKLAGSKPSSSTS